VTPVRIKKTMEEKGRKTGGLVCELHVSFAGPGNQVRKGSLVLWTKWQTRAKRSPAKQEFTAESRGDQPWGKKRRTQDTKRTTNGGKKISITMGRHDEGWWGVREEWTSIQGRETRIKKTKDEENPIYPTTWGPKVVFAKVVFSWPQSEKKSRFRKTSGSGVSSNQTVEKRKRKTRSGEGRDKF